jgi:N-acyl-D-aspartate/D-glutamate deacylase
MAEYDLVIRGGTVVDGTGVPRFKSDVAIKNGRIADISGRINAAGAQELDAGGCTVAPGAIDLHTHYDGQLNWDPYATPSGWFGVTSLTIGQCGFGFAPCRPEDRDLNMKMMNRVEAIPLESMRQGMRWDWETFPEYLDSLDKQGLGLNVGALMPFSPLRGYVLGMMEARERKAVTPDELARMKDLFREGMQAGAFGIAGNRSAEDHPEDGGYLPSHVASDEEWLALAEVLGEFPVGHLGWDIGNVPMFDDRPQQHALLERMVQVSGRPLQLILGGNESRDWKKELNARGLPIFEQTQSTLSQSTFSLAEYNLYDIMPNWVQPLIGTPEERAAKLRDPANRAAMKRDVEQLRQRGEISYAPEISRVRWDRVQVWEVVEERNRKYEGMSIAQLSEATNRDPVDAFIELALDEGLWTMFTVPQNPPTEELMERLKDPYGHISVSDGGAHTRYQTSGHWPIYFLSRWVRDREAVSQEQAHYKMSNLPAWLASFRDRGAVRVGAWADMMVYDLDNLGMLYERPMWAADFPGGERRFIQKPKGLRYTLVNGVVTFQENECTGALPGKLLRSYEMAG